MKSVYCAVRTGSLNKAICASYLKGSDKISNEELWQRTKQTRLEQQIKERKWQWISHTLRKPQGATDKHALDSNRQGTRKTGRPTAIVSVSLLSLPGEF